MAVNTDSPWTGYAARRLVRVVVSLWILVTASFLKIHGLAGHPVRATWLLQLSYS
ncbi:hypothetical protein [Arthrobacter sp. B2a2-09]|uniref:hypothetical protein n=1 Tax=Arthrobacter sp. B2a2-09 TaxID=2952822 RepID=UPI0022CDAAAC|nr:hypothetical protein [Arthrobacter sp. B2a2-09]